MESLALIFDVDGTLADTEGAHREAFNEAFVETGLPWHWSEELYVRLLGVSGGKERLDAYHREISGEPMPPSLVDAVHAAKTRRYTAKLDEDQKRRLQMLIQHRRAGMHHRWQGREDGPRRG